MPATAAARGRDRSILLNQVLLGSIVVLAAIFLGERMTLRKLAGVVTTMAGVVVMVV